MKLLFIFQLASFAFSFPIRRQNEGIISLADYLDLEEGDDNSYDGTADLARSTTTEDIAALDEDTSTTSAPVVNIFHSSNHHPREPESSKKENPDALAGLEKAFSNGLENLERALSSGLNDLEDLGRKFSILKNSSENRIEDLWARQLKEENNIQVFLKSANQKISAIEATLSAHVDREILPEHLKNLEAAFRNFSAASELDMDRLRQTVGALSTVVVWIRDKIANDSDSSSYKATSELKR